MRPALRLFLPAILAIASVAVACSSDDPESTDTPTTTTTATATTTATEAATETATATGTGTDEPTATATEDIVPADGSETTETEVVDYVAQPAEDGEAAEAAECFAESAASGRTDAWRCSIGNAISDPCFALDDTHLRCAPSPLADDPGVLVEVAEPLAEREAGEIQPWLIEVADGTVCGFVTGATGGLDGERLNYGCTNGEWILGFPAEGAEGEPWTAEFVSGAVGQEGFEADNRHEENLATVWR